jgi:serine/threonine protein kinase
MAWNPGQTLQDGKYILESKLGRGRFAITYLAKDRNGKELVIKTLDEDKLNQLTPGERNSLTNKFVNEGTKARTLQARSCCVPSGYVSWRGNYFASRWNTFMGIL